MACTKMAKMEVENTKLPVCLKQFFMFPEHCAFCLCEVLTGCHRSGSPRVFKVFKSL